MITQLNFQDLFSLLVSRLREFHDLIIILIIYIITYVLMILFLLWRNKYIDIGSLNLIGNENYYLEELWFFLWTFWKPCVPLLIAFPAFALYCIGDVASDGGAINHIDYDFSDFNNITLSEANELYGESHLEVLKKYGHIEIPIRNYLTTDYDEAEKLSSQGLTQSQLDLARINKYRYIPIPKRGHLATDLTEARKLPSQIPIHNVITPKELVQKIDSLATIDDDSKKLSTCAGLTGVSVGLFFLYLFAKGLSLF